MKNKSTTNLLRHYCNMHKNEIFDVYNVSCHFKDVPNSSLRKYVSRLVEEGILLPISKGVYFIGNDPTDLMISQAIK